MKQLTSYDIKIFVEGLKERLDIDFTEYANAFLRYRLQKFLEKWGLGDLDILLLKLQSNALLREKFLLHMSVETTEMFRDPGFWRIFYKEILRGRLAKKDTVNILVPFITSDDELYTLLVLLKLAGLEEKVKITATTPFEVNIERTKSCEYSERKFNLANENYKRFTQKPEADLGGFFIEENGKFYFNCRLLDKVDFIVSDIITNNFNSSDGDFDVILFRNRMIYFNMNLQNKVLEFLFYHLAQKGYLIIGFKENISNFVFMERLRQVDSVEKIFKKIK